MSQFVCAFRGRRDAYQVPLALAESGQLESLITDAYAGSLLRKNARFLPGERRREKILSRHEAGIPDRLVKCLWGTTALEHLRHGLGCARTITYNKLDRHFSWAAARRARQTRCHLFLYSPYAWEAFTTRYAHSPCKVLFQYHPHPEWERRILAADSERHPGVGESYSGGTGLQLPEELARRERDCWKHADLIFCASTFTKFSLLQAGADEKKCRVVPYGIEVPVLAEGSPPAGAFHAVFVGSGVQRKGLHHLLLAWRRATLPASSKLTLVCRVVDTEIRRLAAATPRVELRNGVGAAELRRIYAASSLFVMPSLVEGFGQVYLEALAHGCPVLGTANTCLPDLGDETEGVFLVAPGKVDELTKKLEKLAGWLLDNQGLRISARNCAAKFTWPAFRENIKLATVHLLS